MGTRFIHALACAAGVCLLAGGACAATYNEAIDGDLSNSILMAGATPIGTLSLGGNLVTASLTGDPQDDLDNFSFVIAPDTALSAIIWTYDLGGYGSSGPLTLRDGADALIMVTNSAATPSGSNVLGAPLGPGSYSLEARAFGTNFGVESYSIDLRVISTLPGPAPVPLPATGWLVLGGLAALGLARRSRRRGVASS